MIEGNQWFEYVYNMPICYWNYNSAIEKELEKEQKKSYEIDEIVNDFLNNL